MFIAQGPNISGMSTEEINSVLNINFSEYDRAQDYYTKLKNKMLDDIFASKQTKAAVRNMYMQSRETLEEALEKGDEESNKSSLDQAGSLMKKLEKMERSLANLIAEGQMSEVVELLQDLETSAKNSEKQGDEAIKKLRQLLSQKQSLILEKLGLTRQTFENMIKVSGGGDITDITNHAISYFTRLLYTDIAKEFKPEIHKFARQLSIAGFYQEAAEYVALKKRLQGVKRVRVIPMGTKNTEIDNVISRMTDIQKIISGNEEVVELINLQQGTEGLEQELLNKINWYGQQVKSWNLSANSMTYKIGSRSALFNAYTSSGGNLYSTADSARFLAKFENILLSLGPSNVLFSAGSQRYFMCNFIKEFREKQYVLTFAKEGENKVLTHTVALESYVTLKGNMRKRFLS